LKFPLCFPVPPPSRCMSHSSSIADELDPRLNLTVFDAPSDPHFRSFLFHKIDRLSPARMEFFPRAFRPAPPFASSASSASLPFICYRPFFFLVWDLLFVLFRGRLLIGSGVGPASSWSSVFSPAFVSPTLRGNPDFSLAKPNFSTGLGQMPFPSPSSTFSDTRLGFFSSGEPLPSTC